jgi:hypothetical protein
MLRRRDKLVARAPLDLDDVVAANDGPGNPRIAPGSEDEVPLVGILCVEAGPLAFRDAEVPARDSSDVVLVGLREQRRDRARRSYHRAFGSAVRLFPRALSFAPNRAPKR